MNPLTPRDIIAIEAMSAYIIAYKGVDYELDDLAEDSYAMADAMLAERDKQHDTST